MQTPLATVFLPTFKSSVHYTEMLFPLACAVHVVRGR